jgi:hypothetical protein
MNLLSDIITYVRRIIKSPSDAVITDALIIDYINRFWMIDVDARIQLFDLKTKYAFQTVAGVDRYNMPLYSLQIEGGQNVGMYPVYQGFLAPVFIGGVNATLHTQRNGFFQIYPNVPQYFQDVLLGNGTAGPYTINFPVMPNNSVPVNPPIEYLLRGHVDMSGIIATNNNQDPPIVSTLNLKIPTTSVDPAIWISTTDGTGASVSVTDSGQFLSGNVNYGLLMTPGNAPYGNAILPVGSDGKNYSVNSNTVNYFTGIANVTFPVVIPSGVQINAQCLFFQSGLPRTILFYNNVLTLRAPPSQSWLIELDAYLSPSAFLNTAQAIPFGYMAEYIARGAARKILSDTGDTEQFMFYEGLFREQEMLVWKRSQRQFTATRTETIYSHGMNQAQQGNNIGGST